ncbi:MAG: L-seryl-tRNA(Sec) selenium transferase [Gemmatimonadetes bacterium]|nr:L-seryl-tRNA(Sec) selenium transferase [Gemmatimonadota bacterium]
MTDARRALPAVHALLEHPDVRDLLARAPRGLVTDAVREVLEQARSAPPAGDLDTGTLAERVAGRVQARLLPSLRPVFNATGVVLHTNLGRAPLADDALAAIQEVATGYGNLEYDLATGARGSRYAHCVSLLTELTGAEDALVMNNGAGALVLALAALAHGREAVISRGELIEIGGGFRVPEIMAAAGTTLVEVGTTNRTRLDDYRRAIGPNTGAIVKVHRSNFTMDGFVAEVTAGELAPLAAEVNVPVIEDFGSGLLASLEPFGLRGEPTAREVLSGGASVVIMSGDKLLGGPQAGIILGRGDALSTLRRHPLARAFRVDKLTIAALGATLALYRDRDAAVREVPVLAMLAATPAALRARAEDLRAALATWGIAATVVATEGAVGGGAFPAASLPGWAVAIEGDPGPLEARLRGGDTPVIARVADGRLLVELRAVPAAHDTALADAITTALA